MYYMPLSNVSKIYTCEYMRFSNNQFITVFVLDPCVRFLLAIVLSFLLRVAASDYPFVKLFLRLSETQTMTYLSKPFLCLQKPWLCICLIWKPLFCLCLQKLFLRSQPLLCVCLQIKPWHHVVLDPNLFSTDFNTF